MNESNNYQNVERRAWGIMVASFIAYCAIAAAIFYSVRWFLFESETTQEATVTLISGTVFFTPPGAILPQAIVETVTDLAENTRIDTEAGSQAALSFYTPDETTALGSLQMYGGSAFTMAGLRSPRFEWSNRPHHMEIEMRRGRARVSLAVDVQRQIVIRLRTPHGEVQLDRSGSYSIEVTDQSTEVVVRDGAAVVSGAGQSVILAAGERTVVRNGDAPEGVLTGERNLIVNGDFSAPISPADWNPSKDRHDPQDVEGEVELTVDAGHNAVRFNRPGRDWGRVGIEQKINRDVRDYQSLRLHLAMRIARQNLLVCGSLGSECPLMTRIEYTDLAGNRNEWLQGFYYLNDSSNTLPKICVYCPPPKQDHVHVQPNVWVSYDSPDLIALLNKPAIINSITVYAEGHSFESYVSEIELQAGD